MYAAFKRIGGNEYRLYYTEVFSTEEDYWITAPQVVGVSFDRITDAHHYECNGKLVFDKYELVCEIEEKEYKRLNDIAKWNGNIWTF